MTGHAESWHINDDTGSSAEADALNLLNVSTDQSIQTAQVEEPPEQNPQQALQAVVTNYAARFKNVEPRDWARQEYLFGEYTRDLDKVAASARPADKLKDLARALDDADTPQKRFEIYDDAWKTLTILRSPIDSRLMWGSMLLNQQKASSYVLEDAVNIADKIPTEAIKKFADSMIEDVTKGAGNQEQRQILAEMAKTLMQSVVQLPVSLRECVVMANMRLNHQMERTVTTEELNKAVDFAMAAEAKSKELGFSPTEKLNSLMKGSSIFALSNLMLKDFGRFDTDGNDYISRSELENVQLDQEDAQRHRYGLGQMSAVFNTVKNMHADGVLWESDISRKDLEAVGKLAYDVRFALD